MTAAQLVLLAIAIRQNRMGRRVLDIQSWRGRVHRKLGAAVEDALAAASAGDHRYFGGPMVATPRLAHCHTPAFFPFPKA